MGRHAKGPIQLNGGSTWYARLTVKPALRAQAGKTRLIRSLGTTNYSLALRRYGTMMSQLETELRQLLAGNHLRQQIESVRNNAFFLDDGEPLTPQDIALVEGWDDKPTIMEALISGKPLPTTWDELIELFIRVKRRTKERELAPRTINALKLSVNRVRPLCEPHQLDKATVRKLIATMEQTLSPTTVKQQLSLLSSLVTVGIRNDLLDIINPVPLVDYTAVQSQHVRRAFTDSELMLLDGPLLLMVLTGLRAGELATRTSNDIDAGMIVIKDAGTWRPKTLSSYRRVPMPTGFELVRYANPGAEQQRWRKQLRQLIPDTTVVLHSARHTFAELGRRAGVQLQVLETLLGHSTTVGSRSTLAYGSITDDVLKAEANKVYQLVQHCRPL